VELVSIVYSDAVPVYLHAGTGRVTVPIEVLEMKMERQRQHRAGCVKQAPPAVVLNLEAEGGSRREKDRLTWLCRQSVEGAFKKVGAECGPESLPRGIMRDSIIIVPCSQPVRLEDITNDGKWRRDHVIRIGGKDYDRKKGGGVGRLHALLT
jgi:hypothetical protein